MNNLLKYSTPVIKKFALMLFLAFIPFFLAIASASDQHNIGNEQLVMHLVDQGTMYVTRINEVLSDFDGSSGESDIGMCTKFPVRFI